MIHGYTPPAEMYCQRAGQPVFCFSRDTSTPSMPVPMQFGSNNSDDNEDMDLVSPRSLTRPQSLNSGDSLQLTSALFHRRRSSSRSLSPMISPHKLSTISLDEAMRRREEELQAHGESSSHHLVVSAVGRPKSASLTGGFANAGNGSPNPHQHHQAAAAAAHPHHKRPSIDDVAALHSGDNDIEYAPGPRHNDLM